MDRPIPIGTTVVMERTGETMEEMYVNMGPQHPSTHGVLRLMLKLDGEYIIDCIPYIGYLHRCHEKIGENRNYPQVIPYTDRLDYLASMSMNFGYVLAVERLMGQKVPERAEYMRVILAELQGIPSHPIRVGGGLRGERAHGPGLGHPLGPPEKRSLLHLRPVRLRHPGVRHLRRLGPLPGPPEGDEGERQDRGAGPGPAPPRRGHGQNAQDHQAARGPDLLPEREPPGRDRLLHHQRRVPPTVPVQGALTRLREPECPAGDAAGVSHRGLRGGAGERGHRPGRDRPVRPPAWPSGIPGRGER